MYYNSKMDTSVKMVFRRLAIMMLAVMIIVPIMSVPSAAASSVSITGGDNVNGGDTFTVTVTYSGDSVGRVAANMTYDKSMLTYISGGSSIGNNGYIELKNAGTGEDITFQLKFQALKSGSTVLRVETSEMYDLDEQYMSVPAVSSKNVTISGDAVEDEIIEETTAEEDNYEVDLIAVDEKEAPVNYTLVLVIGAVLAAILVIIIAIVIRKKK